MKRIVEKYSEVMITLREAAEFAYQAIRCEKSNSIDADAYAFVKGRVKECEKDTLNFKNRNEILLSEVEEGDVICSVDYKNHKDRAVSIYTNRASIEVCSAESHNVSAMRTAIDKWVKNSNIICYVAKDYREALKWLVKEDSQENNDILITED